MRRTTTALLLAACLATGESLWASDRRPAADPQPLPNPQPIATCQSSSPAKTDTGKAGKKHEQQGKKTVSLQTAQSNCGCNVQEGDPEAPQNRVEYGGGG